MSNKPIYTTYSVIINTNSRELELMEFLQVLSKIMYMRVSDRTPGEMEFIVGVYDE